MEKRSAGLEQSVKRLSEDVEKSKFDLEGSKFWARKYHTRLNESNSSLVTMIEIATTQMGRQRNLTRDLQSQVRAKLASRDTITELKSTVDKLEKMLGEQDGKLSALGDVDARNRRLNEENERLRRRVEIITKVQDDNRSLRRGQKQLQKQVDDSVKRNKALTTRCDELEKQISQQDGQLRALNISNKEFREKEEKTAAEGMIMVNKLAGEERKVEELTRDVNSRNDEVRNRDRNISAKDQEIKTLKSSITQNEKDARLNIGELSDAKDEQIKILKSTITQNEENARLKIRDLSNAKDEEINTLKSVLTRNDEDARLKIGELRGHLAHTKEESICRISRRDQHIHELEGTLVRNHADAVQKLEDLERDITAINHEMNGDKYTLRKQEQHIQELLHDSTWKEVYALEEIANLKQKTLTAAATVGEFTAQLGQKNEAIREQESRILANDNKIQQLEQSLQQALEDAKNKTSIFEGRLEAANIDVTQLRSDLQATSRDLLSKESTITSNKERIEQLEHTRSNLLADLDQIKQRQEECSCILVDKERALDVLKKENCSQLTKIKSLNEAESRLLHDKKLAIQRADKAQSHLSKTKSAIEQVRSDVQKTQEQLRDFVDQRQGRDTKERIQFMHQLAIASIHAYAWGDTQINDIAAGVNDVQYFYSPGGNQFRRLVHIHKLNSERRALIIIHHEDGTELIFHNQVHGFAFVEPSLPADHHIRIDHGSDKSPTYLQLQGDPLQPHAAMRQWLNETLVRQ